MKDEDLELLLESIKTIEIKLDNLEGRIKELDKDFRKRHYSTWDIIHEFRMSIDKKYKEETERRRYLNTLGDPLPEIDEEKDIDVIAETKLKDL
jgi:hypothetical protein